MKRVLIFVVCLHAPGYRCLCARRSRPHPWHRHTDQRAVDRRPDDGQNDEDGDGRGRHEVRKEWQAGPPERSQGWRPRGVEFPKGSSRPKKSRSAQPQRCKAAPAEHDTSSRRRSWSWIQNGETSCAVWSRLRGGKVPAPSRLSTSTNRRRRRRRDRRRRRRPFRPASSGRASSLSSRPTSRTCRGGSKTASRCSTSASSTSERSSCPVASSTRGDSTAAFPGRRFRSTKAIASGSIVENRLPEVFSMHWHGLEIPNEMDGMPGISQDSIAPGGKFTYEFTLHQNGTFFYHSHMAMQEMMGLIGLFIIHPRRAHTPPVDRDFGDRPAGMGHPAEQHHPEHAGDGVQLADVERQGRAGDDADAVQAGRARADPAGESRDGSPSDAPARAQF